MAQSTILRVPIIDKQSSEFVLLQANTVSSGAWMNLKATDGTSPFKARVMFSKLATCKHKQFDGSDQELQAVVKWIFQKEVPADLELIKDIEATAIVEERNIHLTVRRVIGGVKRGILEINIKKDEDVEIPVFEWAGELCQTMDSLNGKMNEYKSKVDRQAKMLENLEGKLEKLTTMKIDHEAQLVVQFKKVLDSKRARIRELCAHGLPTQNEIARNEVPPASPEPKEEEPKEESEIESEIETKSKRRGARKVAALKSKPAPTATRKTIRNTRKRKSATPPLPQPVPEEYEPDNDATASEGEDSPHSDQKDSEDEMPPVRKPVFGKPSAAVPAPNPILRSPVLEDPDIGKMRGGGDNETDDDDDEL